MQPIGVEEYREWIDSQRKEAALERYVAELDDTIAGCVDIREDAWARRAGTAVVYLEVDTPYRELGIGSRLNELLTERASALGIKRIYTEIREDSPESVAFAEHRGYRRTGREERMSRLDVHNANLDSFEGIDERLHEAGIRIATLEQIGVADDRFMRALHRMEEDSTHDIPASEEYTDRPYEEWFRRVVEGVGRSLRTVWVALDGDRPVGVARLRLRGERSAINGYTGVDRAYRGRGIAKALKLRTVEWASRNGIDSLYTGNDIENYPMLAINIALGYQPLPADIEVLKELQN
jgi:mycothiol synthase